MRKLHLFPQRHYMKWLKQSKTTEANQVRKIRVKIFHLAFVNLVCTLKWIRTNLLEIFQFYRVSIFLEIISIFTNLTNFEKKRKHEWNRLSCANLTRQCLLAKSAVEKPDISRTRHWLLKLAANAKTISATKRGFYVCLFVFFLFQNIISL